MTGKHISVDVSEMKEFTDKLSDAAKGGFKKELALFLKGLGMEFLRVVEDEIIRLETVDTRLLLNSFQVEGDGNLFVLNEGDLTIEVGTNVEYAEYVNRGHWKNPKGVNMRFVPGDVVLDSSGKIVKFTYNPNAKTGMTLKQGWVQGSHYWDWALVAMEKMLPGLIEAKVQDWINRYFGT